MNSNLTFMKKVFFFKQLPLPVIKRFLATAGRRRYKAGALIFAEQTQGDEILLIRSGRVRVEITLANQDDQVVPVDLGAGEILGEVSFIEDGPRSATVTAISAVEMLVWKSRDWRAICDSDPSVGYPVVLAMARVLCQRLRHANERMLNRISWGLD